MQSFTKLGKYYLTVNKITLRTEKKLPLLSQTSQPSFSLNFLTRALIYDGLKLDEVIEVALSVCLQKRVKDSDHI